MYNKILFKNEIISLIGEWMELITIVLNWYKSVPENQISIFFTYGLDFIQPHKAYWRGMLIQALW